MVADHESGLSETINAGKLKFTFATIWMDLEVMMLSEIHQSEKSKYHIISLIYGI